MSTPTLAVSQVPATGARVADAPVAPLFLDRWSRRAFDSRRVAPDVLQSLLEAARWAPSASNSQPWLFIVNDDEESLGRARPLVMARNRVWADRAPLLVFVFARLRHPETGAPLRTGAFDTGAAWFALALQAHQLGLATRAMGGIDHEATYGTFAVPREDFQSMAAVAIGYPGRIEDLPADVATREVPTGRRPSTAFAFRGRYGG